MTDDVHEAPQENWLSSLAGAPFVGNWVCLALALAPGLIVILLSYPIAPGFFDDTESVTRIEALVLGAACLATIGWLNFLRRRTGVVLVFFIIPCIWIAWVFAASSAWVLVVGG